MADFNFCSFLPPKKLSSQTASTSISTIVESFVSISVGELSTVKYESTTITFSKRPKKASKSDILMVDSDIRQKIAKNSARLEEYKDRVKKLEWIEQNAYFRMERVAAKSNLFFLTREIEKITLQKELGEYEKLSGEILKDYKELLSKPIIESFVSCGNNTDEELQKIELTKKFMSIANRYIDVQFLPQSYYQHPSDECECGAQSFDLSQDIRVCQECGLETKIYENNLCFKDTARTNLAPRFNYSRRGHFREAIDKYQGKQNKTIPPEVNEMLKKEMENNGLTRYTLTKGNTFDFLSDHDYGDYYDDINLIHFQLTGIPPPNVSEYEAALLEDNDKLESVYNDAKAKYRKNALNVNYKLYKLLERRGVDVDQDDFIFLKTRTKVIEHDEVFKKICSQLGWTFQPTI